MAKTCRLPVPCGVRVPVRILTAKRASAFSCVQRSRICTCCAEHQSPVSALCFRAVNVASSVLVPLAIFASTSLGFPGAASSGDSSFTFLASPEPRIRAAQTELVEVYGYVKYYYLDDTFGGADWDASFQETLQATYQAKSAADVRKLTRALLGTLGDPFTRLLAGSALERFQAESTGQVLTYGLGLDCDTFSGQACAVVFVADGSSAASAGIQQGDKVVAVDGADLNVERARELKRKLQERDTASLTLSLLSSKSGNGPEQRSEVTLDLKTVEVNPVQFSTIADDAGSKIGYIRVVIFAENTSANFATAMQSFLGSGAQALIIDLRDNPGGIISSGLDVARQLLQDDQPFVSVYGRDGYAEEVPISGSSAPPALDRVPMVVLVNNNSASTSEMLAGALRSDRHALVVGEQTFGKGRTQRIVRLSDGALLLVSTVGYTTPGQPRIDGVGISPDVVCKPDVVEATSYRGGEVGGSTLRDDPCVALAVQQLTDAAAAHQ